MTALKEPEILKNICDYLPPRIRDAVDRIDSGLSGCLEELRLKAGLPVMCVFNGYDRFLAPDGHLNIVPAGAMTASGQELEELFYRMCEHSVYAYQEDIAKGFITLKGGHRAGICGSVVYHGDQVKAIKEISSISIRISRQLRGCAGDVFLHIQRGHQDIYNTLVLSPPRCGKTTLLRDLCRVISEGNLMTGYTGLRTAVIDERSELAACYKGIPQNDLGPRTDVLDGCRKPEGIEMMLRGMSPSVIVVDELGSVRDAESIKMAWNAGVRIVATAHAYDLEDYRERFSIGFLARKDGFERYIVLSISDGERIVRVMDTNGQQLYFTAQASGGGDGLRGMHGYRPETVLQTAKEAACAIEADRYTAHAGK